MHRPVFRGGRLTVENLIYAYRYGLFPWYARPIPAWFFPNPRQVLFWENFRIPRSVKKQLKKHPHWEARINHAFPELIRLCAARHQELHGSTWLCPDMIFAYEELYKKSHVLSVGIWENHNLIGGIYGVASGYIFSGESMFYLKSGASQKAFLVLVEYLQKSGYWFLDCQDYTPHTARFGARLIPAAVYWQYIQQNLQQASAFTG